MKLQSRNQQWKKWFRRRVTRYRFVVTWKETYTRPVAEFFRGWVEYLQGPKNQPIVLINGEKAYTIPPEWKDFVNAEAAKIQGDYPIVRLTIAIPKKELGGKYRVRNPLERMLGSNSTRKRLDARYERDIRNQPYKPIDDEDENDEESSST